MNGDTVRDVHFEGSGCAISQASASLMTTTIKGKKIPEVLEIFERFHHMLSKGIEGKVDTTGLGKLAVFSGVCEYPARVKCATLAWHTVKAGIEGGGKVTTE
jgi:nitrogen fixation NifU-like protein